jgi:hypothetical protein
MDWHGRLISQNIFLANELTLIAGLMFYSDICNEKSKTRFFKTTNWYGKEIFLVEFAIVSTIFFTFYA